MGVAIVAWGSTFVDWVVNVSWSIDLVSRLGYGHSRAGLARTGGLEIGPVATVMKDGGWCFWMVGRKRWRVGWGVIYLCGHSRRRGSGPSVRFRGSKRWQMTWLIVKLYGRWLREGSSLFVHFKCVTDKNWDSSELDSRSRDQCNMQNSIVII